MIQIAHMLKQLLEKGVKFILSYCLRNIIIDKNLKFDRYKRLKSL